MYWENPVEWKLSKRGIWYLWVCVVFGVLYFMFSIAFTEESQQIFERWWLSPLEYALAGFICCVLIGVIAFAWAGWYYPRQAKRRWMEDNP